VPAPWQPATSAYYGPPARQTNGLAVASLVLSVLWLGGLGSVLGVIFGFSSRHSIKKSQGQEAGDGLALAGLIIGILGLVGAIAFYGLLIAFPRVITNLTAPQVVALGQSLNVSSSNVDGIQTITVYSVSYPVDDASGHPDPVAGKEYADADVRVCATSSGSQEGPDLLAFSLLFPDGQSVGIDPLVATKQPSPLSFNGLGANECVRGFLTFEIATGTAPNRVQYLVDPFHNYEWALRG
jgi:Domain of unknown function (DUF4190)